MTFNRTLLVSAVLLLHFAVAVAVDNGNKGTLQVTFDFSKVGDALDKIPLLLLVDALSAVAAQG